MPILSRRTASRSRAGEVVYVDAFAGPGEYSKKEPGSPLVAIRAAAEHSHYFPLPIRMFFIERRADRWEHLRRLLAPYLNSETRNVRVELPIHGSADGEVRRLLRKEVKESTPTLIFLDQFGYSAVSMDLVRTIMAGVSREVLAFMNWRDLNRYLTDSTKWPGIDEAFGGAEWREILGMEGSHRSQRFLQLYDEALRSRGNVVYSYSFAMHDHHDQLLYWLVFCSNSDRGLEEMKRAMWSIDTTGHFRFSDKHSDQLKLLPGFDEQWLAERLRRSLAGKQMHVVEIRHYVLVETPCYKFAGSLALLERKGELEIVSAPPGRRRGSFVKYLDDPRLIVRFPSAIQRSH